MDIMGGGVRLVMRSRKEEGGTGGHRLGGGLTCARGRGVVIGCGKWLAEEV